MQDQGVYTLPPTGIMVRWQIYLECAKCREESSCSLAIMAAASIQYFFVASIYRKLACTRLYPESFLPKTSICTIFHRYLHIVLQNFPHYSTFFQLLVLQTSIQAKRTKYLGMSTRLKYFQQFTKSKHCPSLCHY